jgi:hypothetical protein
MAVTMTETAIEPKQPIRLEKKKNMTCLSEVAPCEGRAVKPANAC